MPKFMEHFNNYIQRKCKVNLTIEDYQQTLRKYYEQQLEGLYIKLRQLQRERLCEAHFASIFHSNQPFYTPVESKQ
jgi:hypothetical protein